MELKVIFLETLETQHLQVSTFFTLIDLHYLIFESFSLELPHFIRFSVNGINQISTPYPEEHTLSYLGINSGSTILFTQDPEGFYADGLSYGFCSDLDDSSNVNANKGAFDGSGLEVSWNSDLNGIDFRYTLDCEEEGFADANGSLNSDPEGSYADGLSYGFCSDLDDSSNVNGNKDVFDGSGLEVSWDGSDFRYTLDCGEEGFADAGSLNSDLNVPVDISGEHKLFLDSVHQIFIESGFVSFDLMARSVVQECIIDDHWPIKLCYTLPGEITESGINGSQEYLKKLVIVKFLSTGNILRVVGSLLTMPPDTYRLDIYENNLSDFLNIVWSRCGLMEKLAMMDAKSGSRMFEFWRKVMDEMVLPLLTDLRSRCDLAVPSSFMGLHSDLQMRIISLLPGVQLARMSRVCSIFRAIANDDLWKQKCNEELGIGRHSDERGIWKMRFGFHWRMIHNHPKGDKMN